MDNVTDAAREYAAWMLNSSPNALGQHVHPRWGQSHTYLWQMYRTFGEVESRAAIDAAFKESKA
jgi:hypothetical protein